MMNNFVIVLFKNRKKRKIIKCYSTEKRALEKFNTLINQNKKILFDKVVENAEECQYELGLITNKKKVQDTIVLTDDLGRNQSVSLENPDYVFLKLERYKLEEKLFDLQESKKITFDYFVKNYCDNKHFKNIFSINNKICVQIDEDVKIFSLKTQTESHRFINILEDYFYENKRIDALLVRDVSNAQKKWIYDVLSKKGFEKSKLYRLKTTFSKR